MNHHYNNKLLNNYQNYQQTNIPFNNNMLLQNNSIFVNMPQVQQMQAKLKDVQQIKQIEKINEMEITMDKDKIRESIIKPIKIEKDKKNKQDLEVKWKNAENNYRDKSGKDYGIEIKHYWENRTNKPYKNILKNEDYSRQYKSSDDLVVHKITQKDKDLDKVEGEFKEINNKREKHNDELKCIYSTSNINEHKKKFEYRHVYKYRIQYDPKDHNTIKQDNIKYYKELQKKEEEGKQQLNSLQKLVDDGIFEKDEVSDFTVTKVEVNDTNSDEDKKREKRGTYINRKSNTKH